MDSQTAFLVPDLSGGVYLYSALTASGAVPRFVVSLTMHIRPEILERAVNDVLPLFPQMLVMPRCTREGVEYVPGNAGMKVYRASEKNDAGFDGHLFRVTFEGKSIYFDVHSSMLDEKGMAAFSKSVVFRYIELSGYPIENDGNVRTVMDGAAHVPAEDPLEMLEDIPASRPVWYMDAKAFSINAGEYASESAAHVTQIRIPISRLCSYAREYSALPMTFISPVVSQAVYDRYSGQMAQGEYVVASISVNLRQYFPTLSFRPFFTTVSLAYNRRINEYPFNTILMSQKKLLEAQLKPDALAYNAQRKIADMERIMDCGSMDEKVREASALARAKASASSYMIHDSGTVGMPESMQRYVTEFYPLYLPELHDFTISSILFRNEMVLNVAEKSRDSLCGEIVRLMNGNGIYSYISDEFDFIPVHCKLL